MFLVNVLLYLLTWPFDRSGRLINYVTTYWVYHFVLINPWWHCRFEGRQHIDSSRPYVIVSTHQSAADIFVLYGLLRPFKWVSKETLFRTPLIGWNMMLNRYVSLKRGDMTSTKDMFDACEKMIAQGESIMMFPEGTRSVSGDILRFKRGAFRLACELNVPIVPVIVDGTRGVLPKGQRKVAMKANINVRVLPPVEPESCQSNSHELCDYVFDLMKDELESMRAEQEQEGAIQTLPELARTR